MTSEGGATELLARLQSEGRAPRVGDVVNVYTSRRRMRVATVESVRLVRHAHRVVVYIDADGRTFETRPITGWFAMHGIGDSTLRMTPRGRDAHAAIDAVFAEVEQ